MPKRIIEIPPEIEKHARKLIERGSFQSFDHLIAVALENQFQAEEGDISGWVGKDIGTNSDSSDPQKSCKTNITETKRYNRSNSLITPTSNLIQKNEDILRLMSEPLNPTKILSEPPDENLVRPILWGQFYRFLPSKVALRILATLSKEKIPILTQFKIKACDAAEAIGNIFQQKDNSLGRKLDERLSTSFPEPNEKSRRRFMEQYLIYIRPSDGKMDGMLAGCKFLNVESQNNSYNVGITKSGLEFASLKNPLLDNEDDPIGRLQSLTKEESNFLIKHIMTNMPQESLHMCTMLGLIADGTTSRKGLNEKIFEFYKTVQDPSNRWTSSIVNTMRAGLTSRLYELGLIEKTKKGLAVIYHITESGRNTLELYTRMERRMV